MDASHRDRRSGSDSRTPRTLALPRSARRRFQTVPCGSVLRTILRSRSAPRPAFPVSAVEIVSDAARRAGIELDWVETGTSSDEAFRKGMVDLWPLMVDLPDRRKFVHFAPPYMHSSHVLALLEGTPAPGRDFRGRIAVFKLPLHVQHVRSAISRSADC